MQITIHRGQGPPEADLKGGLKKNQFVILFLVLGSVSDSEKGPETEPRGSKDKAQKWNRTSKVMLTNFGPPKSPIRFQVLWLFGQELTKNTLETVEFIVIVAALLGFGPQQG